MKSSAPTLEEHFADAKPVLSEGEATAEAQRCINCYSAPCIRACPTEINIPQFISRIASGNTSGAAKTILESNILGLSCAKACPTEVLCEGACVYNHLDKKPISIGKLQQYAVEYSYRRDHSFFRPGADTGKSVALIGAGPASLACAHELRRRGHKTVIYERKSYPGGLNTSGIAPYKMKVPVSLLEIDKVSSIGIEYQFGTEIGVKIGIDTLLDKYDAVFLGMGLDGDRALEIPGSHHPEIRNKIFGAVAWIETLKTNPDRRSIPISEAALVIGGGNTAIDVCRELKGLGFNQVIMSYRRSEKEMSGYQHELIQARQTGVEVRFNSVLKSVEPTPSGKIGATLRSNLHNLDSTSRADDSLIFVDCIVLAAGQNRFENILKDAGISLNQKTGQTSHPKVFAGGDLLSGGQEVVHAVADGKRAAILIHNYLEGSHRG